MPAPTVARFVISAVQVGANDPALLWLRWSLRTRAPARPGEALPPLGA